MRYYAVMSIVLLCGGCFGYVISEIKNKKKQQCMSCECDLEKGEAIVQCAECACVPVDNTNKEKQVSPEYERIYEPEKHEIVYFLKDNNYTKVKVVDGKYISDGRISNFWYWVNVISEDGGIIQIGDYIESGYGNFFKLKSK